MSSSFSECSNRNLAKMIDRKKYPNAILLYFHCLCSWIIDIASSHLPWKQIEVYMVSTSLNATLLYFKKCLQHAIFIIKKKRQTDERKNYS